MPHNSNAGLYGILESLRMQRDVAWTLFYRGCCYGAREMVLRSQMETWLALDDAVKALERRQPAGVIARKAA